MTRPWTWSIPTVGRPSLRARCWRALDASRRPAAASAWSSWTTGRAADDAARRRRDRPAPPSRLHVVAQRGRRARPRHATPAGARRRRPGSPSSTTTSSPLERLARRLARRPRRCGRRRLGLAGRSCIVPLPDGPAADRLGARRSPASSTRAGRPPTWPTGATALERRRRLRRALPARLPRGRRPRPARAARAAAGSCAAAARRTHPVRPPRRARQRAPPGRQPRRRAHAGAARPRLAARGRARRPAAPAGTPLTTALAARRAAAALAGGRGRRGRRGRSRGPRATAEFAAARIAPGPADAARGRRRWSTTSVAHPAAGHRAPPRGARRAALGRAGAGRDGPARRAARPRRHARRGRPVQRRPGRACSRCPGVVEALRAPARAGLRLALVSNQSGIARGLHHRRAGRRGQPRGCDGARRAARRVRVLPARARRRLRVPQARTRAWCSRPRAPARRRRPRDCVLVGDIGADVHAAARGRRPRRSSCRPRDARRGGRGAPPRSRADFGAAVDRILARGARVRPATSLVVRLDSDGDVLLAGPAIRAVAAGAARRDAAVLGPRGAQAAELLPGVDEILGAPRAVDRSRSRRRSTARATLALVDRARAPALRPGRSSSPRSTRARCRPRCCCASPACRRSPRSREDYPGSLLDVRHRVPDDLHEVERGAVRRRARSATSCRRGDDGALRVTCVEPPPALAAAGPYVVVHPGASVPARAWPAERHRDLVARARRRAGTRVVVTGGPDETALTAARAPPARARSTSAAGRRSRSSPACWRRAGCVVVGNTGPAHLAAAVGTPGRLALRPHRARPRAGARGGCRRRAARRRRPLRRLPGAASARSPATPACAAIDVADGRRRGRRARARPHADPGGRHVRIAMVSEHASPLAAVGGDDAGGQNVHVARARRRASRASGHEVVVHTRRDDPDLPRARARSPSGVDRRPRRRRPAARTSRRTTSAAHGRFAAEPARRVGRPTRPTSCTATSGCRGYAALQAARPLGIPVVHTFHALGVVKRREQGAADTSPPERVDARARAAGARRPRHRDVHDEVFELLPARWRRGAHQGGAVRRRHRRSSPRTARSRRRGAPTRPRGRASAASSSARASATSISAIALLDGVELRRRRRPAAGRARARPGGPRGCVRSPRARASPTASGLLGRVERARRCPPCCARPTSSPAFPWYEPFGIVPLEAMACGRPVVATRRRRPQGHRRRRGHRRARAAPRSRRRGRGDRALLADPPSARPWARPACGAPRLATAGRRSRAARPRSTDGSGGRTASAGQRAVQA